MVATSTYTSMSVRRSILKADIVMPTLNAVSEDIFNRIARPVKGINAKMLINGLIKFRNEYNGKLFLELFIIPGLNDREAELVKIRETCLKIRPDKIQLNTIDRPGVEKWIEPASIKKMLDIKAILEPFSVEIVNKGNQDQETPHVIKDITDAVVSTIARRPSTLQDLSKALGAASEDLTNITDSLLKRGKIEQMLSGRGIFYKLKRNREK